MRFYDFDPQLQRVLNEAYSGIHSTDWRSWLNISSREEYESLALKPSGLENVDNIFDRIKREVTDPKQISVEPNSLVESHKGSKPVVCCHTSGTSGGTISDLKFYNTLARKPPTSVVGMNRKKAYLKVGYINSCW
jgi:hypothetical protein